MLDVAIQNFYFGYNSLFNHLRSSSYSRRILLEQIALGLLKTIERTSKRAKIDDKLTHSRCELCDRKEDKGQIIAVYNAKSIFVLDIYKIVTRED